MHLCDATPWWLVVGNVVAMLSILALLVFAGYQCDQEAKKRR